MRRPDGRWRGLAGTAALLLLVAVGLAHARDMAGTAQGVGTPVGDAELRRFLAVPPDGAGLPPGGGTVAAGEAVFGARCASCHGDNLGGTKAIGAPALIGGRGSLAGPAPVKTVESYWPYATTLFDYVRRAMPMDAPGSLGDDEVYAVSAYILSRAGIAVPAAGLDAATLPAVEMPNRNGFVADYRPGLTIHH